MDPVVRAAQLHERALVQSERAAWIWPTEAYEGAPSTSTVTTLLMTGRR